MVHMISVMLLLVAAPEVGVPASASLQERLGVKVTVYSLSADNLFKALHRIASDFEIPIGIEWVRSASTRRRVDLSWHDSSVCQMLDDVIAAYGGYNIQEADEIVNVAPGNFPTQGDILNLRVPGFEVRNEPLGVASWKLHSVVQSTLRPRGTRRIRNR